MKVEKFKIEDDYIIHNISNGDETAYKAVIPAFHGVVFGANLSELEEGISLAIKEELKVRRSAPKPDK